MKLIVSIIVVGIQAIYAHSDNAKEYRCCRETDHYTDTEHTICSIIIAGEQIIIKHRETDKDSIGVVGKQAIIHIERLPKAVLFWRETDHDTDKEHTIVSITVVEKQTIMHIERITKAV